jgi:chemotaxis methyl-accepting protein methylase
MSADLQDKVIAQLGQRFGLDSGSVGESMLLDALRTRQSALGMPSLMAYLVRTLDDAAESNALGHALLVHETWFDRDPTQLDALTRLLRDRDVKTPALVWSAPCSTGEECYSIAARFLAAGWLPEEFSVVGLDVSQAALSKARARVYPRTAWRSPLPLPHWLEPQADGSLRVSSAVASRVSFRCSNLVQPQDLTGLAKPGLVFSRNFFIYLTPQARARWLDTLHEQTQGCAWLFTGPGEPVSNWDSRFTVSDRHPHVFDIRARATRTDDIRQTRRAQAVLPAKSNAVAPTPVPAVLPSVAREADAATPAAPRARELADKGLVREALTALLRELADRTPTADDFALKATLLLSHGQRREADEALGRALYLDPAHDEARALRMAMHHADASLMSRSTERPR